MNESSYSCGTAIKPPPVLNPAGVSTQIFTRGVLNICQTITFLQKTRVLEGFQRGLDGGPEGVQMGIQKGVQMRSSWGSTRSADGSSIGESTFCTDPMVNNNNFNIPDVSHVTHYITAITKSDSHTLHNLGQRNLIFSPRTYI